ncbi:hypothetical protein GCM10010449_46760 [Streptomyces rectiviolaceus]|uniref:Uncharacterized protein n=1 Tax=Streptomyces rectiviolaceus TaxID=332591 RepID=A0ABP6MMA5_9ACTN
MPDVMPAFAQPPDGLLEVGRLHDGHRHDNRPLVFREGQVEHLVHTLPSGRKILEVPAQTGRHHAVQPEPDVLRIADDTADEPPPDDGPASHELRQPGSLARACVSGQRPTAPRCWLRRLTPPSRCGCSRTALGASCGRSDS